jgi:hypothetical protein
MSDQPVARPLRAQDNTNIHALSGIRNHDPSVRASDDSSCLYRAATLIGSRPTREYIIQEQRSSYLISATVSPQQTLLGR